MTSLFLPLWAGLWWGARCANQALVALTPE